MNIKSLFRWRITFGALWKGNIPFEKGHIRVMKANVTNGVFGLSSHLFKIWTWSSHRMWKTRLQILCIVFEAQFGIVILKITNMCFAFAHQATHLRFSPQLYASIPTMSKVSLFRSSSFLGVLWEANMPFEKNHTWRDMKTKVSVKKYLVHTNFKRTVKRIILTGIIYSWSTLKRIRPIFQIFWRYLNIYY